MKKGLLLMLAALLTFVPYTEVLAARAGSEQASPQKKVTIKGTVVDEQSVPVIGATVMVAGNAGLGGTMTDEKGEFTFDVPVGMTIQVSCIGYDSQDVVVEGPKSLFITLKENSEFLDEVVVVGYGTQTKESIVGAISTVSSESISNTGSNDIMVALNGKVAGISQIVTSGAPGEDTPTIFLRGLSSWNGSQPLYLVDGVERSIGEVNPDDVASVSVLKDASATAVFGAKGANGVIMVTTKTGNVGRAKMSAKVEYGAKSLINLPEYINSATTLEMANAAMKNDNSYSGMYSDYTIAQYRNHTDSYRYPDIDWNEVLYKKLAPTYNASFSITGGSERVKYYASANYFHEGSILKDVNVAGDDVNYSRDRIQYRLNLDANLTKTTVLSFKLQGTTTIDNAPISSTGTLFSTAFQATGALYPAFFGDDVYEKYPDIKYPDASGVRLASEAGANFKNPMNYLLESGNNQSTEHRIATDVEIRQDLKFITKGLSAKIHGSIVSAFSRASLSSSITRPTWSIDWNLYDQGYDNYWVTEAAYSSSVYVETPYEVTQSTAGTGINFIYYVEGGLDYNRSFGKHNVTATALYSQRQYNGGASSPKRNQSVVGRVTYNYAKKYLLEVNAGVTGSEQFAPKYRYGFFPSAAVGYVLSNEKFWKKAMPWWSTMKIRYSDGLVGSDSSNANFLYYTAYTTYTGARGTHYVEGSAANEGARWETAHKRDIGFEFGWFKNDLTLNVDLYDEYRYDMLVSPVVTPLVGVKFKDTNSGSLKKHGIDVELNYRHIYKNGFSFSVGGLFGVNENRIVDYPDITYAPQYQKKSGTPYGSNNKGSTLIDDKYFQNINEIHGYTTYTTSWSNVFPGAYKFLDYKPDGIVDDSDLHTIAGSTYPPCTYSLNFTLGYKGWTFRMVGAGTFGKYLVFNRGYMIPFLGNELKVHPAQLDYWTPTNRNASAPALSFSDVMYSWGGGTSAYPGYDLALDGYTWRNSDYFAISELYIAYKFTPKKTSKNGIDGLTISLSSNNLAVFSGLIEGNCMSTDIASTKYPLMRTTKIGLNLNF